MTSLRGKISSAMRNIRNLLTPSPSNFSVIHRNGLVLRVAILIVLSAAVFGQQRVTSIDEMDISEKTKNDIRNLIDTRIEALEAGLLDESLLYTETFFDNHFLQVSVVNRCLESETLLEFDEGLIYHGRRDLDEAILKNQVKGESFFTRIAHEWAIGFFNEASKSPAIFVMDTKVFNRLVEEGKAEFKYIIPMMLAAGSILIPERMSSPLNRLRKFGSAKTRMTDIRK